MKKKLENLKNNQAFQNKLQEMKPKRNIWGVLGVVLFFFVPELVNALWHVEITVWIKEIIESAPPSGLSKGLEWATDSLFTGEISFFNIGLGVVFLVWIFWDDVKTVLKYK